ncbi:MAG: hypothetical protein ACREEP_07230 [Dongiaceae bacterium]
MPVSKSKRKKKAKSPAIDARLDDPVPDEDALLGDALADELDTESATAEVWKAGRGFRPEQLDKAQELAAEAWDSPDPGRRLELATRALKICPWCGDAYGLLAMGAPRGSDIAVHLWRLAMAAAEFALKAELGKNVFEAYAGEFWGRFETRPYMRARAGLANALIDSGDRDAALGHHEALLQLNPNDNQGLRYSLAGCLLALGREQALADLLAEYEDDDSAFFAFNRAALSFRREGDSAASRALLADALAANPHVAAYLLGKREMPPARIELYAPGSEDEAILYVECSAEGWRATPGALQWLGKRARSSPASA